MLVVSSLTHKYRIRVEVIDNEILQLYYHHKKCLNTKITAINYAVFNILKAIRQPLGSHDTQQNDIKPNDTQHNDE